MTDLRRIMLRDTLKRIGRLVRRARAEYGRDQSAWPKATQDRFSALTHKASQLQEAMGR